jgi:hypothetical protein
VAVIAREANPSHAGRVLTGTASVRISDGAILLFFPTLDATEEVYAESQSLKFTRSITTVKYVDYKFFTVETEVVVK